MEHSLGLPDNIKKKYDAATLSDEVGVIDEWAKSPREGRAREGAFRPHLHEPGPDRRARRRRDPQPRLREAPTNLTSYLRTLFDNAMKAGAHNRRVRSS